MENQYLKKIIAQSPEDLNVISACCSEGRVNIKDVKYLASNKIFLMSILRLSKEEENKNKQINSIIKFEFINSSKSKNIDQSNQEAVLELVGIDYLKNNDVYEINLIFNNNAHIALTTETIEARLEDQSEIKR